MGDYRDEARILSDGFVKGMTALTEGLKAMGEAIGKGLEAQAKALQPISPPLMIPVDRMPDMPLKHEGVTVPRDMVAGMEVRACNRDDEHRSHSWDGTDSIYWCTGYSA